MVSWGVEAPTYIASLAEMDWTKQRARRFSRDVSRDEPRPAKIAALAEQDSRPASVRAAERAAAGPKPPGSVNAGIGGLGMWPPQRLKSVTPRGAAPRSASLAGATSAPVLLRPLGHMPGYERSLTLLTNRHEGTETTERTARLQRPRPDGVVNVPPRRFPGPPHATRAAGCAFPVATIRSVGAPLLGCGASADALLAIDQAGAAPSRPVVAADSSTTAANKSRAARRRWHLARDMLVVPLERKVAMLKGLGFLEGCSGHDLIRLAQTLRVRLLGRMRQLVRQYEHPSFFGILLHGSVEVHDMNAGMSMLEAGECVGLEALGAHYGDYIPSLSTLITSTPCLLLVHALPAEVQKKQS